MGSFHHENAYGIKVLNLSLGYQSSQLTVTNPLDQAVQAVWNSGITVVTSAGNAGPFNGTILSPATIRWSSPREHWTTWPRRPPRTMR